MNDKIVIVSAKRTPIGKINGTLASLTSVDLGTIAAKATIKSSGINPKQIDQVIFGNVIQAGGGQNVARQIELNAGIPNTATASTINQVCGSGMKAVRLGQSALQMGDADVILVGGTEGMSNAPYLNANERKGHKFGPVTLEDSIQKDGLNDAHTGKPMGITAENVADRFHISRTEQDAFALQSHQKASAAQQNGYFNEEMIPIEIKKSVATPSLTEMKGFVLIHPWNNLKSSNHRLKKTGRSPQAMRLA
ncbi:acetyl-CoA C-acyltransferase [Fructilactobacillus fructivorans]|nr:acetyl-CoA acetyltransferase [Fructilactobacillus fructivorans]